MEAADLKKDGTFDKIIDSRTLSFWNALTNARAGGSNLLANLLVEKASSSDVKKFGQRMVDDHSRANDQLKQLASQKKVDLPQDLSAKDKATKASLEKLSGEQFDQAYMKGMVKDHKKDVSEFRRESTSAQDPDVKKFAAETLPTLEDHLKQAEDIASPMSAAASAR